MPIVKSKARAKRRRENFMAKSHQFPLYSPSFNFKTCKKKQPTSLLSLRKSQKFFRSTREKKEEKINGRKDEPQNVSSLPINPKANNPTESEFGRKRTKKKKKTNWIVPPSSIKWIASFICRSKDYEWRRSPTLRFTAKRICWFSNPCRWQRRISSANFTLHGISINFEKLFSSDLA